jgi:hypothetical protein
MYSSQLFATLDEGLLSKLRIHGAMKRFKNLQRLLSKIGPVKPCYIYPASSRYDSPFKVGKNYF